MKTFTVPLEGETAFLHDGPTQVTGLLAHFRVAMTVLNV